MSSYIQAVYRHISSLKKIHNRRLFFFLSKGTPFINVLFLDMQIYLITNGTCVISAVEFN